MILAAAHFTFPERSDKPPESESFQNKSLNTLAEGTNGKEFSSFVQKTSLLTCSDIDWSLDSTHYKGYRLVSELRAILHPNAVCAQNPAYV